MFNVQQRVITSILKKKKTEKGIFPLKTLGCQSQGPELDMDPDVFSPDQQQNDLGKEKKMLIYIQFPTPISFHHFPLSAKVL